MDKLKLPPASIEAEQSVIGSILILDDTDRKIREIFDILRPEMFYSEAHRIIYSAILKLKTYDLITVSDYCEQNGQLEQIGGFAYIAEIAKNTPSAANCIQYAEIIADRYFSRELLGFAHSATEKIYSKEKNQDVIDYLSKNINGIDLSGGYEPRHISGKVESWIDMMEQRVNGDEMALGIKSGISRLDEQIVGIGSDWLVTLAGRPSHGKTLLSQLIASHVSQTRPVLYFTMEMSADEIMDRFVGVMAGVNPKSLKTGTLNEYEWSRVNPVLQSMNDQRLKMYYDEDSALSINQIRHRAKTTRKKVGEIGMIVIDYLGLMERPKADRDDLSIGIITRGLKQLAKEIKTPVLLLAQANRAADGVRRPTMANLYGSSAIEADSDLILFTHREEVQNEQTALRGVLELIPAKFRHGDCSRTVYLAKDGDDMDGRFRCLTDVEVGDLMNQEEQRGGGKIGTFKG